jgi:hypothetical protein
MKLLISPYIKNQLPVFKKINKIFLQQKLPPLKEKYFKIAAK